MKGGGVKGEKGRWKHRWGEEERESGRQKREKETWRTGREGRRERGREGGVLPYLEPPSSLPPPFSLWNIPQGPPNALGNCLADQGPHLPAENHEWLHIGKPRSAFCFPQ